MRAVVGRHPQLMSVGVVVVLMVVGWFSIGSLDLGDASIAVTVLFFAIAGLSFNLLHRSLGVFSLGQAVFVATGGFTGVYLYNHFQLSPWWSILIAPVVAAIIALPLAFTVIKVGGSLVLTTLVTLIYVEAVPAILNSVHAVGGAQGLSLAISPSTKWTQMQFLTPTPYARILLLGFGLLVLGLIWFRRSRLGLWADAVRDSEGAARAVGIPVNRVKLVVFLMSAMIAAPAGVVFAQYNTAASSALFLSSTATFQVIVVALVGGMASPWGSMAGAIVVVVLSNESSDLSNGRAGVGPLTFAAIFAVMALLLPRGLSGTWKLLVDRWWKQTEVTARLERADAATSPAEISEHV